MKKTFNLILAILFTATSSFAKIKDVPSPLWFKKATEIIHFQLNKADQTCKHGKNPRSVNPHRTVRLITDWTTDFFF